MSASRVVAARVAFDKAADALETAADAYDAAAYQLMVFDANGCDSSAATLGEIQHTYDKSKRAVDKAAEVYDMAVDAWSVLNDAKRAHDSILHRTNPAVVMKGARKNARD